MRYGNEADETGERGRSQLLEKLLVPVAIAGHVLFYDVRPSWRGW